MLTTAVVPLRLRSMAVLLSSESAMSNALFSTCETKFVNNMACTSDAWLLPLKLPIGSSREEVWVGLS